MVASYVRPDAAREVKLKAARGDVTLRAGDLGALLFFLSRDPDPEVRNASVATLRGLSEELLFSIASSPETHPLVLDILARIHCGNGRLIALIVANPGLEDRTLEFLVLKGVDIPVADLSGPGPELGDAGEDLKEEDEDAAGEQESFEEESEERLSKYKLLQTMSISEKIRMAMIGDKEWRSLLLKETNKLVSTAVIKNPRITDPEILAVAKSSDLNEEVIRLVSMNREWVKIYPIRKALVENHKTPLPKALRFLSTLNEKDVLALAKSKNVSSVIARQAQRLAENRKK